MTCRPWFLSITARWATADGYPALEQALADLGRYVPAHQRPIVAPSLHFTVFAMLRVNGWAPDDTGEDVALGLLAELVGVHGVVDALQSAFRPIAVDAFEVTSWDAVTSVQFRAVDTALAEFRREAARALRAPVHDLCQRHADLKPLLDDPNKNAGDLAFGSFARSPGQAEAAVRRWRRPLDPSPRLRFDGVTLVCSDEALTNPAAFEKAVTLGAPRIRAH